MFNQLGANIRATWIFFVVRLVASALVGLIYIIIAAAIQYFYVELFGETTFNYIVGGAFSLFLGSFAAKYLGSFLFMFIRGWHVAALAYAKQIEDRNLPALEVGMTVFRKHFTSFAVIYGASILIRKFAKKGTEELWELLKDVPYLCSLERFAKNPIVAKLGSDILDTAFDGVVYYIIKYTKPGVSDDVSAFPTALKRYLYALPQVMLTSLGSFFVFYVVPKFIRWLVIIWVLFSNGLVAGILINVLLYPVFYVLRHGLFEPLEMMSLISCYSKHCTEDAVNDEGGVYQKLVNSVLEAAGFEEYMDNAETTVQNAEDEPEEPEPAQATLGDDDLIDVAPDFTEDVDPVAAVASFSANVPNEVPDVADLPLAEDEPSDVDVVKDAPVRAANLADMIKQHSQKSIASADESIDSDEPDPPPVTRLGSIMSKLTPEAFNQAWGAASGDDDSSDDTHSSLGGDDFDFQ